MGLLVDGKWHDEWYDTEKTSGRFVRQDAGFRSWVTIDGAPGPTGTGGFKAETGRYHLYVSFACPWAHRTLIVRQLKNLTDKISLTIVDPLMLKEGWTIKGNFPGTLPDSVNRKTRLHEIYTLAKPVYTGRVTVPVLWDKRTKTIVSNESSDIIRMFNSAFNEIAGVNAELDLYPEELRAEIDAINSRVYNKINNGVYKSGFATTQEAYDEAVAALFDELNAVEKHLSKQRYLASDQITEVDWRLFTTLIRFDAVYHGHFKCNLRRIGDYPNLSNYTRELYQVPGVAETVNFDHIKHHYYASHRMINPTGIVPKGPIQDFNAPHNRGE